MIKTFSQVKEKHFFLSANVPRFRGEKENNMRIWNFEHKSRFVSDSLADSFELGALGLSCKGVWSRVFEIANDLENGDAHSILSITYI